MCVGRLALNRLAYGLGMAGGALGAFLVFTSVLLYMMGALSFNYDVSGWAILMFVVGLVLVFVGWRIHKHDRNTAARPPPAAPPPGPAGPPEPARPPAGVG